MFPKGQGLLVEYVNPVKVQFLVVRKNVLVSVGFYALKLNRSLRRYQEANTAQQQRGTCDPLLSSGKINWEIKTLIEQQSDCSFPFLSPLRPLHISLSHPSLHSSSSQPHFTSETPIPPPPLPVLLPYLARGFARAGNCLDFCVISHRE